MAIELALSKRGALHDSPSAGALGGAPGVLPHAAPSTILARCYFKRDTPACFPTRRPLPCPGSAASSGAPRRDFYAAASAILPAVLLLVGRPGVLPHAAPSTILPAVLLQAGRPGVLSHAALAARPATGAQVL